MGAVVTAKDLLSREFRAAAVSVEITAYLEHRAEDAQNDT
jgi:hypothetical protein